MDTFDQADAFAMNSNIQAFAFASIVHSKYDEEVNDFEDHCCSDGDACKGDSDAVELEQHLIAVAFNGEQAGHGTGGRCRARLASWRPPIQ